MKGARVALRTLATGQFQRFFDTGRALMCLLSFHAWWNRAGG